MGILIDWSPISCETHFCVVLSHRMEDPYLFDGQRVWMTWTSRRQVGVPWFWAFATFGELSFRGVGSDELTASPAVVLLKILQMIPFDYI